MWMYYHIVNRWMMFILAWITVPSVHLSWLVLLFTAYLLAQWSHLLSLYMLRIHSSLVISRYLSSHWFPMSPINYLRNSHSWLYQSSFFPKTSFSRNPHSIDWLTTRCSIVHLPPFLKASNHPVLTKRSLLHESFEVKQIITDDNSGI